jgi:peptidoglycan/xylan/chitin deacetylase (PgdA/CDA1 family)
VRETGCTPGQLRSVARRHRVALMLHSISDPLSSDEASYYISPKRFHGFMRRFRSSGYRSATLRQWIDDEVPDKHVLLTFDDAYDDLYTELFPVVIEHDLTPVIYLVADRIGASNEWDQSSGLRARNLLTLSQIREMQKHGVEFGSHSLSHPWLPGLPDKQLHREVRDSKLRLEELLGTEITSFAYPSGGVDQRVRSAVAAAGYKTSFTTQPGPNWWNDPLCQRRADVNEFTTAVDFLLMLRCGRGLAQGVSSCLEGWEQTLPTQPLRTLAHQLRTLGHWLYRR